MTNYERIKTKSIQEMAELFSLIHAEVLDIDFRECKKFTDGYYNWLVKEEEHGRT
jgi:hypothetical protein